MRSGLKQHRLALNASSLYFAPHGKRYSRFYSAEKFYDYLNKSRIRVANATII